MIIYGDILILENTVIGVVLLIMTDMVCRCTGQRTQKISRARGKIRVAVGGIMCGIFSLTVFVPAGAAVNVLMELAFAPTVCAVVFGKKGLLQRAATFILTTYFTGGITMGLLLLTQNTGYYSGTGIYTGDMKAALLAVFIAFATVTVRQISKFVANRRLYTEHTFDVNIVIDSISIGAKGFLDTGNSLRESVSGKPVAVAKKGFWQTLEKGGVLVPRRLCIIPFTTVSGGGVMEGIRADYVEIGSRRIKGCVIAKGGADIFDGREGFDLLLSNNMHEGGS